MMSSDDQAPARGRAPETRLPAFLRAFSFRSYRTLWSGAFLSSLGTWTQDVALNWLIHVRFLDPRYLGYKVFATDAPLIAFMVIGGAVADRIDRRRILLVSQLLQMSFAAALGFLYVTGRLSALAIVLVAFLTGLAQSQSAPTYQAVLTTLVPPRYIQSAVALNSLQFNLSRAIGPVIAGLLLARAGTGWCFAVNAVSFLAVIAALWRIRIPSPATAAGEPWTHSLAAGFRLVIRSPVLSTLTSLAALSSFLSFPLVTYLPVLADDTLRAGAHGYSALLSSFGIGAIAGALRTAQRGSAPGRGRLLTWALSGYGASALVAVATGVPVLTALSLLSAGFCLVSAFSILNALVQESAPDSMRGRVVGIYGVAFRGGMPLGSLVAGFLVRAWGAPVVLGTFSVALILLALGLHVGSGRLRRL